MGSKNLGIDEKIFNYIITTGEESPFYTLLGISISALGPGYAELSTITRRDHANPLGTVHGGMLLTIADGAMGNAIRSLGIRGVTVDCSTAMISAAPFGEKIIARGRVLKAGRNLIFAESQVFAGEKLLADTRGTFYKTSDIDCQNQG